MKKIVKRSVFISLALLLVVALQTVVGVNVALFSAISQPDRTAHYRRFA